MSNRERDNDYEAVVAKWRNERLIECKDRIQWIWQIYWGGRWRSEKYFRSRQGILHRVKPDAAALAAISALPDMFPKQTQQHEPYRGQDRNHGSAGIPAPE
jgi:hypothetical protein